MNIEESPVATKAIQNDGETTGCRSSDKATLPRDARLPINRCNLPAVVLGSLSYQHYLEMRSQGLSGTNALEAQLDLVYTFSQYELARRHPLGRHVTLYRGVNRLSDYEILSEPGKEQQIVLLNNLNSFTCSRDRACEFGDTILAVDVPLSKIFFHCRLLPSVLQGEDEFLVIGGVTEVSLSTF